MAKRLRSVGIITMFMTLFTGCAFNAGLLSPSAKPEFSKMKRGVNLGNFLEAPEGGWTWGEIVLEERHFYLIKEAGFDSLRIPVRWSGYAEAEAPFAIREDFFERVDWAVENALRRRLNVIINIHHYNKIMETPGEHKERFLALWEQIAAHYQDYPEVLYFEVLNEPHNKLEAELWNEYLLEAVKVIRRTNPKRKLIVGGVFWNNVNNLPELSLPEDDPNIIATFHYYLPFQFTHQGAGWVEGTEEWLGTTWRGTDSEKAELKKDFDGAVRWARENDRQLFLGEFGAYRKADMDSRVCWTNAVAREAEARNIPWMYWEFCASFGIYDRHNKGFVNKEGWRYELLEALIPLEN